MNKVSPSLVNVRLQMRIDDEDAILFAVPEFPVDSERPRISVVLARIHNHAYRGDERWAAEQLLCMLAEAVAHEC